MIQAIRYIFWKMYKPLKINYGDDGGAFVSYINTCLLLGINLITIVGFIFNLFLNKKFNFSLNTYILMYVFIMVFNYFILLNKHKYLKFNFKKSIIGTFIVIFYFLITFALFAIQVTINSNCN